jgi:hypothetical protein
MAPEEFSPTNFTQSHLKTEENHGQEKTALRQFFNQTFKICFLKDYFFEGGKSVQLPCATSAAMPMLSPKVG